MRQLRYFPIFAVLVAMALPALAAGKPNIVFILADDLGYAELGCYGQTKIKTPRIDGIAAQGMRFTRNYSGNAVCAPSRCVLMTGKHPGHAEIEKLMKTERVPSEVFANPVLDTQGAE